MMNDNLWCVVIDSVMGFRAYPNLKHKKARWENEIPSSVNQNFVNYLVSYFVCVYCWVDEC